MRPTFPLVFGMTPELLRLRERMDAANEAANEAESKCPVHGSLEWQQAESLRLQAAEAADEFIAALLFADCPADESAMPADTR